MQLSRDGNHRALQVEKQLSNPFISNVCKTIKTHNEHKGYAEQCIPFIFIINHKNHETNTAVPLAVTISILLLLPIVS